jgi:hypothetical protein
MFFSDADTILGVNKNYYMTTAKRYAKAKGYNPNLLTFSTKPKYKLNYDGIDFGSSINMDYIFYKRMEKLNFIDDGEADDHRRRYLARATKIKGNWQSNPLSKNNLSIRILWNG